MTWRKRTVRNLVITTIMVVSMLVLSTPLISIHAASASKTIQKIEYEGAGMVDVEFWANVVYTNALKVTVKAPGVKAARASIGEKDEDDIHFIIANPKAGKKYTFTIAGVTTNSGSALEVKGSVSIPKKSKKPKIEEISYDAEDSELSVDFVGNVTFKSRLNVLVKSTKGKRISSTIIERDKDSCDLMVSLAVGKKYTVTIKGVKKAGTRSYFNVSKSFIAYDD